MDAATQRVRGEATLGEMALAAGRRGAKTALRQLRPIAVGADDHRTVSYRSLRDTAVAIAQGLIALGVQRGQVVAILSNTRAEWTIFELAAMCTGAVLTPIYQTCSPQECAYVLAHSQTSTVLCEDMEQLVKVQQVREQCPDLTHVLLMQGGSEHALALRALVELGRESVAVEEVHRRVAEVRPEQLASIVYTSGTTGPPKGCMLTHRNLLETIRMYRERMELHDEHSTIYMFLPLAHVLARIVALIALDVGGTLVYWSGDPGRIVEEVAQAQPTHFVAVPRVYEKIHSAVLDEVDARGPLVRLAFTWALEVGRRARLRGRAQHRDGALARARLRLAERIGLAEVRRLFGPRLRLAAVGAAPCEAQLLEFFDACGVLVLEGYGMTESCAAATANPPGRPRFGTVGTALPGTEVAVATDGEILISGPHVFAGYHRNDQATREILRDGWLASGDLGSLSPDGYLTVTGRRKDLIVTSSGKNIGPTEIENGLRQTRWIAEAVVYGDRRPYLVAMLVLDRDEAPVLARRLELASAELYDLAAEPKVHELLAADVCANNARLARIEQVKRFAILPHELTQQDGELTPTLKVKRSVVYEKYASFFDRLYEEPR